MSGQASARDGSTPNKALDVGGVGCQLSRTAAAVTVHLERAATAALEVVQGDEEEEVEAAPGEAATETSTDSAEIAASDILLQARSKGVDSDKFLHAVVRVQQAYRLQNYVYRNFGPILFYDSEGGQSHGRIDFLEGALTARYWIRVVPTSSALRLVKMMDHYWGLPKPEVLITVTGGAQDFALSTQLQQAFDRGLVSAATSAKAWLITAGSDTGVMRLVGDAIAKQDIDVPLLGIFPWGVTNGREKLEASVGKDASYAAAPASGSGAPLNANHTHFILVDNGKEGGAAWGSEISLRAKIEATVSNSKNVPIVQLVVQGGPGTLATVESTALEGKPVVILSNSGGAASAIWGYCCNGGIDAVEQKFQDKKLEKKLASIDRLNQAYDKKLITFFSLEASGPGGEAPDLSTSLLEGIIKMMKTRPKLEALPEGAAVKHPIYGRGRIQKCYEDGRQAVAFSDRGIMKVFGQLPADSGTPGALASPSHASTPSKLGLAIDTRPEEWDEAEPEDSTVNGAIDELLNKALGLTVVWDRPELARKILASIEGKTDEVGTRHEVAMALQRALELQRGRMTEMLFRLPGILTSRINMGRLYMQPDEYKYLRNSRALQTRLQHLIKSTPYQQDLAEGNAAIAQNYHAYKRACVPFFRTVSPVLGNMFKAQSCTQRHDLFFWLVCQGNETMARALWAECDLPVHMMLLAAQLTSNMAKNVSSGNYSIMSERFQRFQMWARDAIGMAPDEAAAHAVLEMCIYGDVTAIDIAMHTKAKAFLSQRHCVSLVDRWWRGGSTGSTVMLAPDFSWPKLLVQLIFPFLHPDVRNAGKADEQEEKQSSLYDALGLYMTISDNERKAASVAMRLSASRGGLKTVLKESDHGGPEVETRSPLASFYAVPAVRFLMRMVVQMVVSIGYIVLIFANFVNTDDLEERKADASIPWDKKMPLLFDVRRATLSHPSTHPPTSSSRPAPLHSFAPFHLGPLHTERSRDEGPAAAAHVCPLRPTARRALGSRSRGLSVRRAFGSTAASRRCAPRRKWRSRRRVSPLKGSSTCSTLRHCSSAS